MKTRLTQLFGIKYPIIMAGMSWITYPKMVAAVSNAGALGMLATTNYTSEQVEKEVREIKQLTDKPFGVNQVLVAPNARANMEVAIREKVPIINYTLGRPGDITPLVKAVHEYGGKVMGTIAVVRHAARAEQLGVDAINVTGHEAAAHGGLTTSLVLIPLTVSSVKIPVTAAGGFFDGRGLAAALALGAEGVTMGTRFAATKESPLHEHWKQIIVKATEQDTVYLDRGDPILNSRVLRTKRAEDDMKKGFPVISGIAGSMEIKRLLKLSWWQLIRSSLGAGKGEGGMTMRQQILYAADVAKTDKVIFNGDEAAGTLPIGQVIGGVRDIPTCQELIERIMAEAQKAWEAMKAKFGS